MVSLIERSTFKRLCYSISSPIKDILVKYFRDNNIRKDPLDQSLIEALLDNDLYYSGISIVEFKQVVDLYKGLAEDLQIAKYKDLVSLTQCRFLRNIQEHEIINTYIDSCKAQNRPPNFNDLLNELNLIPLQKYKKQEMICLEKIFMYYIQKNKY